MDLDVEIPLTSIRIANGNLVITKKSKDEDFETTEIVRLVREPKKHRPIKLQQHPHIVDCIFLEVADIKKINFKCNETHPADTFNIFQDNFKKILVYGTIVYANSRTKNGKRFYTYKIDDGTGVLRIFHFPRNTLGAISACQQNSTVMKIIEQSMRSENPKTDLKEFKYSEFLALISKRKILQRNSFDVFKKVLVFGKPFKDGNNEVCLNVIFAETNESLEQDYKKMLINNYNK